MPRGKWAYGPKEMDVTLVLEQRLELSCEYDADEDVMYAWVGERPRAAITYETSEGHLVRLDPETKEFVGVTIFEYEAQWADKPLNLAWESEVERSIPWIPLISRKQRTRVAERGILQHLPA